MKTSRATYFRRCHICDTISFETKKKKEIEKCEQCNKAFIPFLFFDDHQTPVLCDNEPRPEMQQSYLPIRGFTSYW